MPEDFRNGHGVSLNNSLGSYLDSRDFVLNQVAANHSTVKATRAAIQDLLLGDIRLTKNALQERHADKLVAKALRMQAQAEATGKRVRVHLPDLEIRSLHAALHYDRAWGADHEGAIQHFSDELHNGARFFRSIPSWQLHLALGAMEDDSSDAEDGGKYNDLHLELQNLPQHQGMGQRDQR